MTILDLGIFLRELRSLRKYLVPKQSPPISHNDLKKKKKKKMVRSYYCLLSKKSKKPGLSFIEFNMFPINIFKILHNKHVFTELVLIFFNKRHPFFHQKRDSFK